MADLLTSFPITRADKLGCARREIKYRKRVYNHYVFKGKMTKDEAAREIAIMTANADDYERGSIKED